MGTIVWRASINPVEVGCRGGLGEDSGSPLGGGVRMTIDEAEEAFEPPLFRPQTRVASDDTIDALWVRERPPTEAFIVYESGVVVLVERVKRPTWQFARDQIADGVPGELIDIRGIDAFAIAPDPPCFGGNTAFNLRGTEIAIIGDVDLPFATVRQAAESIIATAPTVLVADAAAGLD